MLTEVSVIIDKPAKEVWDKFQDSDNMSKWMTAFQSIELTEGEQNKVGSKYLLKFSEKGRDVEFYEELTGYEECKLFACNMDSKFMTSTVKVDFEELSSNQTKVTSYADMKPRGLMMKIMFSMMKGRMRKQAQGDYNRLKAWCESE